MRHSDVADWLTTNCENWPNQFYGVQYRAAARMRNGLFLPCVLFLDRKNMVDLYARRLKEVIGREPQFISSVETLCTNKTQISAEGISHVEHSRFAWPRDILEQIVGETSMGFTIFTVEMRDGQMFDYGTEYSLYFFEMPARYVGNDILRIHSWRRNCSSGAIETAEGRKYSGAFRGFGPIEHFTCYVEGLA